MQELPGMVITPPITMREVEAFAAASGDWNPIHLSDSAARDAGLDGAVVHGMYIAGCFEMYLERLPELSISELQVHFIRPVPVGNSISIAARPLATGSLNRLRLLATITGGRLVAIAEAVMKPDSGKTVPCQTCRPG